jgi:hypothetical protein
VAALVALVPARLPGLRHLNLDECGLGGHELAALAGGLLGLAGWLADAFAGALGQVRRRAGGRG